MSNVKCQIFNLIGLYMSVAPPLVSIIMPSYNVSGSILDAINSVISQSYTHWELIIIDDCSTDDTVFKVSKVSDDRVKLIELNENSGSPAHPRNIGIDASLGEFIAFLDADDRWKKDKLDVQINHMLQEGADFSCSGYSIFKDGTEIKFFIPPEYVDHKKLLKNNSVGCLTAIVRRGTLGEMRFPLCGHEDFALWLKLLKKTKYVLGVQNNLADYNLVEGSVSHKKYKLFPYFWNIYRNEEKLSIGVSLYYCLRYFLNVVLVKYRKF